MNEAEILREKIAQLDKELEEKNALVNKSNEELLDTKKKITFLRGQIIENEEANQELSDRFQALFKKFEICRMQLNEMTKNCRLLENETEKKTLEIDLLKKQIEEKNSLIIDLKREITSFRKEAEKTKSKVDESNQISSFTVTNPLLRSMTESIERNRQARQQDVPCSQINMQSSIIIDKNNSSLVLLVAHANRPLEFENEDRNDDSVMIIEDDTEPQNLSKIISSSNQNKPLNMQENLSLNKNLASSTPTQPVRVKPENPKERENTTSISQIIQKNLAACFFVDNNTNRIRLNEKILNQNIIDQILEIIYNRKQDKKSLKIEYDATNLQKRCVDSFQILLDFVFQSLTSYANFENNLKAISVNEFALIIYYNEYICSNFELIANDVKEITGVGANDLENFKQDGVLIIRVGAKSECESLKQKIENKLLALDSTIRLVILDEIVLFSKKLAEIVLKWLPTFCIKSEQSKISVAKHLVNVALKERANENLLSMLVLDEHIYWKVDRTIIHKFLAFVYFNAENDDLAEVERVYAQFLKRLQNDNHSKPQIKLEDMYYNDQSQRASANGATTTTTRKNNRRFNCPFCSKYFLITISYKPYRSYYNHKCLEKK